MTRAGSTA
jgi:hypothetical protein